MNTHKFYEKTSEIEIAGHRTRIPSSFRSPLTCQDILVIPMEDFIPERLKKAFGEEDVERNIWGFSLSTGRLIWKISPISSLTANTKIHVVPTPYFATRLENDKLIAKNWAGFYVEIDPKTGGITRIPQASQRYKIISLEEIEIGALKIAFPVRIADIHEFNDMLIVALNYLELRKKGVQEDQVAHNVSAYSLVNGKILWQAEASYVGGFTFDFDRIGAFTNESGDTTIDPVSGKTLSSRFVK